jgi:hypothetical protein
VRADRWSVISEFDREEVESIATNSAKLSVTLMEVSNR